MSKKKNGITPLGDRVLVMPTGKEDKTTPSGIIIPDTVEKERPETGVVVAVGEGRTTDEGNIIPMNVSVGDTVIFSKYGPDEIKIEGEDFFIISESAILAVLG